jgi:chorismate dehydratase
VPKLRVGIADTLDARALAWGLLKGHHADLFAPVIHPTHLIGRLLEQGGVDVALTPSFEVAAVGGLRVLPDLCIAFPGAAGSLILLSHSPFSEIRRLVRERNAVAPGAILSILLAETFGLSPEVEEREPGELTAGRGAPGSARPTHPTHLAPGEAVLLTGGAALTARREGCHVLDLGTAWRELTGLPLVVSVWAVRSGVELPELPFYFKSSLRYGLSSLDAIAREGAAELGVGSAELEIYLRETVGYLLRNDERRGLQDLFDRAARHGLVPERRLELYGSQ